MRRWKPTRALASSRCDVAPVAHSSVVKAFRPHACLVPRIDFVAILTPGQIAARSLMYFPQGVVRETMRAARTGESRTILVQRGESSRVEVRDEDGVALLEIAIGLVRMLHTSDSLGAHLHSCCHRFSMCSQMLLFAAVVYRSSLTNPTILRTQ
jgi:hypothetical protein